MIADIFPPAYTVPNALKIQSIKDIDIPQLCQMEVPATAETFNL